MSKQNQIIVLLSLFVLLGSNSVFGGAKNIESNSSAVLLPEGNLEDSLVGVWEVTNLDVSAIRAQIAAAKLQVDKDGLASKITAVQNNLMGMKMTINGDHTFQNSKGNNFLSGNWKLNNRDLITHSLSQETKDRKISILSLSGPILVVKQYFGDSEVVVTYTKR